MTISNQTNRTSATGSGSTGQEIPFLFPITSTSDVKVYKRITATGVPSLLLETTNYTVTISGDSGGTVTTVTAIEDTEQIHIVRNTPDTQLLDLEQGGAFSAPNVEIAFDKNTKLIIEKEDAINRIGKPPATDPTTSIGDLPSSIDRASKQYGWDSAGKPSAIEAVPEGSVSFSTIGENIAEAADADAVTTLLQSTASTVKTGDINTRFPYIDVRSYGVVAGTDSITELQAATDAAEAANIPLLFPPSATNYIIAGTWYVGNVSIWGYGATLELDNDASWGQLGAATRNDEAGILTKSAAAAGYGISTVELHIQGLTIYNNRTASGGTSIVGPLLLEQVRRGSLDHVRIYADTNYNMTLFDLYANVKNFNVSNCEFSLDNNGNTGGVWVRNFDTSNPTENINFDNCKFYTTGTDEILAIFQSSTVVSTVKNVSLNNVHFVVGSGASVTHVITIGPENASGIVRDITLSNFTITANSNIISGIKATGTAAVTSQLNISNGTIRMKADLTSTNAMGIRSATEASISNVSIHVTALTDFSNIFYGFFDCGQVTGCKVTFESGINITSNVNSAGFCDEIVGCDFQGALISNTLVANCSLTDGRLRHNKILTYNDINISNDVSSLSLISNTTDNGANYVIGNSITETYDSDTTEPIFAFDTYGPVFCNYNYYTGDRETWLNVAYNVVSFKGNYMDSDGSGVIMGFPNGGRDMSDASTAGTGEDILKDTIIYADHLGTKGGIRVTAAGTITDAAAGDKTVIFHFGTKEITIQAAANTNTDWRFEAIVVNTATGAQRITWAAWNGATVLQGYDTTTQDTTANVTVKITGECSQATDDITQTMWLIEDL